MANWQLVYVDESGASTVKRIVAGEKWTQAGVISFVNREIVGGTMRVVTLWEIEENRVSSVEVLPS